MILKITPEEARNAIKHYYKEVKGFNIGNVAIIQNSLKKLHFELEIIEEQNEKDLPVYELKSVHDKLEEDHVKKVKKGK